jgi:phosphoglycolate phosphatase
MTTWVSQSGRLTVFDASIGPIGRSTPIVTDSTARSVVFDFDGTIADSFQINIEVANRLALDYGITPVTPETLERWQDLGAKEILQELNISMFRLPGILRRFKSVINEEVVRFPMIPGMRETILSLWDKDCVLGVVTSNSAANVRKFLAHQGIEHLFDFVESCPRLIGKERVLNRIATRRHLSLSKMMYVGDETRDIDAAKQIHVKSVAVTWGFNSEKALTAHHPDYLIDRPQQILDIFKQL